MEWVSCEGVGSRDYILEVVMVWGKVYGSRWRRGVEWWFYFVVNGKQGRKKIKGGCWFDSAFDPKKIYVFIKT